MPSHQDRVRQNNCEHNWNKGITVADIVVYKCSKCGKFYYPGISKDVVVIDELDR